MSGNRRESQDITLLTTAEAAAILRLAPKTLANWYTEGKGPKSLKIGRSRLYRPDDLRRFIDDRESA